MSLNKIYKPGNKQKDNVPNEPEIKEPEKRIVIKSAKFKINYPEDFSDIEFKENTRLNDNKMTSEQVSIRIYDNIGKLNKKRLHDYDKYFTTFVSYLDL